MTSVRHIIAPRVFAEAIWSIWQARCLFSVVRYTHVARLNVKLENDFFSLTPDACNSKCVAEVSTSFVESNA